MGKENVHFETLENAVGLHFWPVFTVPASRRGEMSQ